VEGDEGRKVAFRNDRRYEGARQRGGGVGKKGEKPIIRTDGLGNLTKNNQKTTRSGLSSKAEKKSLVTEREKENE